MGAGGFDNLAAQSCWTVSLLQIFAQTLVTKVNNLTGCCAVLSRHRFCVCLCVCITFVAFCVLCRVKSTRVVL